MYSLSMGMYYYWKMKHDTYIGIYVIIYMFKGLIVNIYMSLVDLKGHEVICIS